MALKTLSAAEKTRIHTLYGPWAVVTGASSGIGCELARLLAHAGLNLVLVARSEAALGALAKEWQAACGIQTRVLPLDLSQPGSTEALAAATRDLPIGLLVASAGYGTSGAFLQTSAADEINLLRVNCEALLAATHHFAGVFAAQKRGGIVLLSSMVAFQGVPFAANYAASKAYVQTLAEALAVELKPHGVDVLAAAPGPVASGFGDRADMRMNGAMSPDQIGIPILRALGRKTTVFPGLLTKFLTGSLALLPRQGKIRVMQLVVGGMTQHQRIT